MKNAPRAGRSGKEVCYHVTKVPQNATNSNSKRADDALSTMTSKADREQRSRMEIDSPCRQRSEDSHFQSRCMRVAPVVTIVLYVVLLLSYHVEADRNRSTVSQEDVSDESGVVQSLAKRIMAGPDALTTLDKILFGALILMAFEILNYLTRNTGRWLNQNLIPVRGKHLDELSQKDLMFVGINKAATAPFVYIFLRYAYFQPNILWEWGSVSVKTLLLPLPALFVVYDFFYTILHWALHIKAIYGYIHKHHHHQKAPSRANVDAVNVHPIEFFLGEYNHLLAFFLCSQYMQIHVLCGIVFLAVGGALAGINHTRYDTVFSFFGFKWYDSKAHDVHHRIPQSNYGQYIMLWDIIFGSYRPYDENDRVNPKAQLDPKTGKSVEYMEAQRRAAKVE